MSPKLRRVCIVGFSGAFDQVPWQEPGWELWGFNQMYRSLPPSTRYPFTRWFELHLPSYFARDANGNADEGWAVIAEELNELLREPVDPISRLSRAVQAEIREVEAKHGTAHLDRVLRRLGIRRDSRAVPIVYLPAADPLVPGATAYPKAKVEALTPRGHYHAGSFDWMVALALAEGFTHIRITGVNFALGGEPISARPCLEYWLGVAEGLGVRVEIMGNTDLFRIFHLLRSDTQYGFAPWALVEEGVFHPPADIGGDTKDAARRRAAGKG